MLNKINIINSLDKNSVINRVEYFEEIDSTNTYLLSKADSFDGLLAIAEYQTNGKGRLNRKWLADKGKNLTFSFCIIPKMKVEHLSKINFCTAVSLAEVVQEITEKDVEIKWPNDLLIDGKKFCGMLIESKFSGNKIEKLVIGIGININQTNFPEDYRERTTSLKLAVNRDFEREEILLKFINRFSEEYTGLNENFTEIFNRWKDKCKALGNEISLSNGEEVFSGVFHSVNEDGSIFLKTDNGLSVYSAGDVTVIKKH